MGKLGKLLAVVSLAAAGCNTRLEVWEQPDDGLPPLVDLGTAADLTHPIDLGTRLDLAPQPADLTVADLVPAVDLTPVPDLRQPADLSPPPPDLSGPFMGMAHCSPDEGHGDQDGPACYLSDGKPVWYSCFKMKPSSDAGLHGLPCWTYAAPDAGFGYVWSVLVTDCGDCPPPPPM